jgi:hypothetical protein
MGRMSRLKLNGSAAMPKDDRRKKSGKKGRFMGAYGIHHYADVAQNLRASTSGESGEAKS